MPQFDTGHGTLKTSGGIGRLWNNCSFGFTIVAFPTSTFWPLMVCMVHGVSSACEDMSATSDMRKAMEMEDYIYVEEGWCD